MKVPLTPETYAEFLKAHPDLDWLLENQSYNRPDLFHRVNEILTDAAENHFIMPTEPTC